MNQLSIKIFSIISNSCLLTTLSTLLVRKTTVKHDVVTYYAISILFDFFEAHKQTTKRNLHF